MSISNSQYDAIMRMYEARRENSRHTSEEHRAEVYELIPEYKAIEGQITDVAMESARRYLEGDKDAVNEMKSRLSELTKRQTALILQYGFPEDYLEEKYVCNDCKDTGYIDGRKCHCLNQEILKVLYKQSNIAEVLNRENFDTLSYDYYDDADIDKMNKIIDVCKEFASDFGDKYENIMLYGNVGVGKTFLTNCMAKEIIQQGYSVIYFTSIRLFDTLSKCVFSRDYDGEESDDIQKDIYNCDLLIIDDLGTETVSSFVASRLFDILNERDLRHKSTIISTNLPFDSISDRYSERNFSRIFGNYRILNPDIADIRIKKRRQSRL